MGTISKGILGGFSGTVGTVVGGRWKGIDYIRSKSGSRRSASSPKQKVQQARFKLVNSFLQTMAELVKIGFLDFAIGQTGRNHALSYNLENAVTGIYPNLALDFSQVLVTRGSKLPNVANPTATAAGVGAVGFNWQDNSGSGKAGPNDKAILVVYCPALRKTEYTTAGPVRSAGSGSISIPEFSGQQVHTWLSFIAENEKDVATSIYTGMLSVQ